MEAQSHGPRTDSAEEPLGHRLEPIHLCRPAADR